MVSDCCSEETRLGGKEEIVSGVDDEGVEEVQSDKPGGKYVDLDGEGAGDGKGGNAIAVVGPPPEAL